MVQTVKIVWEREEAMFMGVSAIARLVSPRKSKFSASSFDAAAALHGRGGEQKDAIV
jgi:hypothetical protein